MSSIRTSPDLHYPLFYHDLTPLEGFDKAWQTNLHCALPGNWWIIIADVVDSSQAVTAGRYKSVNSIGAACIASIVNIDRTIELPFVFGGDGATFAIPDMLMANAATVLRGAQRLARESFGLELRVGMLAVADLGKMGFPLKVAKMQLSPHLTHAVFSGRGWQEAERLVKMPGSAIVRMLNVDDEPAQADFSGFECRWQSVPHFNGHKLSLLIVASSDDPLHQLQTYLAVSEKIHAIYGGVCDFHPLRAEALHLTFNPDLLSHEWRVRSSSMSRMKKLGYLANLYFLGFAGKYLFARGLDTATVQWSHYRHDLVENSDFRKFDGMLRMIIDGNDAQLAELQQFLESQYQAGHLAYGLHKSREALVTCLVKSYTGDHLHFIDGSDGGYATAALELKRRLQNIRIVAEK